MSICSQNFYIRAGWLGTDHIRPPNSRRHRHFIPILIVSSQRLRDGFVPLDGRKKNKRGPKFSDDSKIEVLRKRFNISTSTRSGI
jgi:hypothetical protein